MEEKYNEIRSIILEKYNNRNNIILLKLDKILEDLDKHIIEIYMTLEIKKKNIYLFTVYHVIEMIVKKIKNAIDNHNFDYQEINDEILVLTKFQIDCKQTNRENLNRLKKEFNDKLTIDRREIIKYIESIIENN